MRVARWIALVLTAGCGTYNHPARCVVGHVEVPGRYLDGATVGGKNALNAQWFVCDSIAALAP